MSNKTLTRYALIRARELRSMGFTAKPSEYDIGNFFGDVEGARRILGRQLDRSEVRDLESLIRQSLADVDNESTNDKLRRYGLKTKPSKFKNKKTIFLQIKPLPSPEISLFTGDVFEVNGWIQKHHKTLERIAQVVRAIESPSRRTSGEELYTELRGLLREVGWLSSRA